MNALKKLVPAGVAFCTLLTAAFYTSCSHETENFDQLATVCFEADVLPVFQTNCAMSGCHNAESAKAGMIYASYETIVKSGIKPGDAAGSETYRVLSSQWGHRMPPVKPLTEQQRTLIRVWIDQGLKETSCASGVLCDVSTVSYTKDIAPIIASNCVKCHGSRFAGGGVKLETFDHLKLAADKGSLVGTVKKLPGYKAMPIGGKLTDCQVKQIEKWVKDGAKQN